MERLQLYISKSLKDYKILTAINGSEIYRRRLHTLRQALETVDYDPMEKCVFYLLRYVDGATFFSILRTIPDKPLDHLEATIVVPCGLEISADELYSVIREVTRKVSNAGINADDIARLQQIFAREYPVDANAVKHAASVGHIYACEAFGGDTGRRLRDYLGDGLYRPAFTGYAGVLLADADLPFKLTGPAPTGRLEAHKSISPASFLVTSRISNDRLTNVNIRVNGVLIDNRHTFPEEELENARVDIESAGYQPYHGYLDLATAAQVLVELTEVDDRKIAALSIDKPQEKAPAEDDEQPYDEDDDYPGEGMKWWVKLLLVLAGVAMALGVCLWLFPDLWPTAQSQESAEPETEIVDTVPQASIAALRMEAEQAEEASLAVQPTPEAAPATEPEPEKTVETPAPAPAASAAASKEIADYLDGSAAKGWWSKDELEKYPQLKGLYDDLNNYNFDALINTWPDKVPDSEWLKKIARHAREARSKKLEPKTGSHSPNYTTTGRIHRNEYINWINRRKE